MDYICQNCGVESSQQKTLCNPIINSGEEKLCRDWTHDVCRENASQVEYSCLCGNVSANPQFLCDPINMWES